MPLASAHLWPSPLDSGHHWKWAMDGCGSKWLPKIDGLWWIDFSTKRMGPPFWPINSEEGSQIRLGILKRKTSQFPVGTDHTCLYFKVPSLVPLHGRKCIHGNRGVPNSGRRWFMMLPWRTIKNIENICQFIWIIEKKGVLPINTRGSSDVFLHPILRRVCVLFRARKATIPSAWGTSDGNSLHRPMKSWWKSGLGSQKIFDDFHARSGVHRDPFLQTWHHIHHQYASDRIFCLTLSNRMTCNEVWD